MHVILPEQVFYHFNMNSVNADSAEIDIPSMALTLYTRLRIDLFPTD